MIYEQAMNNFVAIWKFHEILQISKFFAVSFTPSRRKPLILTRNTLAYLNELARQHFVYIVQKLDQ